ncbi:MAG: PEP-CTERM sorting domain-containing protein [Verrucomicrobia bacterium]|nr:PEP-CTERM sorting domain-containing protein [Verrucomicrobiota bacterium]
MKTLPCPSPRRKRFLSLALVAATLATTAAFGTIISYTVGGVSQQFPGPVTPPANAPWGTNGYPGDTVGFIGYTGTLDLTPGSYVQKVNTLAWSIDYTYGGTASNPNDWSDLLFTFTALRGITLGTTTGSISQGGDLAVTWDNDYLSLASGAAVALIVDGYKVTITPQGLPLVGGSNFSGGNPWEQPTRDVMAQFVVEAIPAVPEGANSLLLLGGAAAGVVALRRRKSAI